MKSCLIDQYFTLKIGDLGYAEIKQICQNSGDFYQAFETNWRKPKGRTDQEKENLTSIQKHDVKSFGMIAHEICFTSDPDAHESGIVQQKLKVETELALVGLLRSCEDCSDTSLDVPKIKSIFIKMFPRTKRNVVETILRRASSYAQVLEESVRLRTQELLTEQANADYVLEQILPR